MGILNATPDSFSDGGEFMDVEVALSHARKMIRDGASIIDVGGESTRPGALEVDPAEEWRRIGSIVSALCAEGVCVSVDTRHAEVASYALDAGASIVNDVSGFRDRRMVDAVRDSSCGLVVMHMQGDPEHMQENTQYGDVVSDVYAWLSSQTEHLQHEGVSRNRICIDPGPGFGKTAKQTIELLRNLHEFVHMGYPIMVAASRKSYLKTAYKIASDNVKDRDAASAAEALLACELGASVVRTHNVEATAKALADLRPYVLLGLGSNVALVANDDEVEEGKIAQINMAIGDLCQLPDSQIIDISPFYRSEAAYVEDQDSFVNNVVLMRSGIAPKELLEYLHIIENRLGRTREIDKGPRTIDIDILDYQLYSFSTDELTLPHPMLTERDFVVKPIQDILPGHILADGMPADRIPEEKRVGRAERIG